MIFKMQKNACGSQKMLSGLFVQGYAKELTANK
jgi:hypothetical protein